MTLGSSPTPLGGAQAARGGDAAPAWDGLPGVRRVARISDFDAIHQTAVDCVVLDRHQPEDVAAALAQLSPPACSERYRGVGADALCSIVDGFLHGMGLSDAVARGWITHDVESLAKAFAELLRVKLVDLRLEIVRDDACRKFHRDAIRARMICTYIGPGTELQVASGTDDAPLVASVPFAAPVLLKGKAWASPDEPVHTDETVRHGPVTHRSPAIAGAGVERLVVVLDEALPAK